MLPQSVAKVVTSKRTNSGGRTCDAAVTTIMIWAGGGRAAAAVGVVCPQPPASAPGGAAAAAAAAAEEEDAPAAGCNHRHLLLSCAGDSEMLIRHVPYYCMMRADVAGGGGGSLALLPGVEYDNLPSSASSAETLPSSSPSSNPYFQAQKEVRWLPAGRLSLNSGERVLGTEATGTTTRADIKARILAIDYKKTCRRPAQALPAACRSTR